MTPEDFWQSVDTTGGPEACHPFTGYRDGKNYGRVYVGGVVNGARRRIGAHKYALELTLGETLGRTVHVLHRCDNPPCCNPAHLYPGDQRANNLDMATRRRGRTEERKGERNPIARVTAADVRAMRQLRVEGESYRAIGQRFGLAETSAYQIVTRRRWAHVE